MESSVHHAEPSVSALARTAKPLHVVVVTPLGFGGRGGIDRLMDELRIMLKERGDENVDVSFITSRGPGSLALSPFYVAGSIVSLMGRRLSGRVNVVHINLSQDGSSYRKIVIAFVCRRLGIPYLLHLHGSHYHHFWNRSSPWFSRALTKMFAGASRTVVLGTVWAEFIRSKVPDAHIEIFPTATRDLTPPRPRMASERVRIFFSGRHGTRKGVEQLVEALGRLAQNPHWQATLTGDGTFEKTRETVKALGIADRVDVPGWISTEDFENLLSQADILALPSFDENLPLSVVEAFARGIAVISTHVGALPDIVKHEDSGLVVEPGDVDGLTAALERLIDDPDLRARLGRNARAVYEDRLNLDAYAQRLLETWRSAAALR